jgi:hypothetical protein
MEGMERIMKTLVLAVLMALGATVVRADWQTVGEVPATDESASIELAVNRTVRTVQLECTQGAVLVNTVWIREGEAKTEIRVARRFNQGEKQDIDLGYDRAVTGLRISHQGAGKLKVNAK